MTNLANNQPHFKLGMNMPRYSISFMSNPPFPDPHDSCPRESTFYTPQMVRHGIDQFEFGKAQDHDGLVGAH